MNANPIARIAADVNRIATISFAKEHTTMNTVKSFVRRAVRTLGAAALLALATASVKADVIVDTNSDGSLKFTGPQQACNDANNTVNPGLTVLQLKVHNTDPNVTVSGITVQTYIYFASDVNNGWLVRAMPKSNPLTLGPNQSEWISIVIPPTSLQGQALRGHYLYAKAIVDSHTYWLNNFLDASFNITATVASEQHNSDGSVSVKVEFSNAGHIASLAQSVSLSYMPYAGGNLLSSNLTTTAQTLPALQPNQITYLTFRTASIQYLGYSYVNGWVQIGSEENEWIQF